MQSVEIWVAPIAIFINITFNVGTLSVESAHHPLYTSLDVKLQCILPLKGTYSHLSNLLK